MMIERYRTADGALGPGEMLLPESVAQNSDTLASALILLRGGQAPGRRMDVQRAEVVSTHKQTVRVLDRTSAGEIKARVTPSENTGENILMIPNLFPERIGERRSGFARALRIQSSQLHEFLRLLHGKHPEHHRVDQAEDRGVGADSERQRKNRHTGDDRSAAQDAQSKADVLQQRFDEGHPACIAMLFFKLFHSAEFQARPALGFLRWHTVLHELRDLFLEVKAQLLVHFSLNILA